MTILFLHGWQSVPGGVKPTYLKDCGHTVVNPRLPDEDFAEALRIAQAEFDEHHPQVIVGSSRGGAVAMNIKSGTVKLVLLCPAWKRWGTAITVKPGTVILHSRADDVVPFADSEELAKNSGLPASALIEVGTDHRLADPEPLEAMRKACASQMNPNRLTNADFKETMSPPMRDVTEAANAILDIRPYVDSIPATDVEGHSIDDVEHVYRSGDSRFEHVLIRTGTKNVFLVIILDVARATIFGHHLLDLNREYGLPDPRSQSDHATE